jgi:hypothetical protein
MIDPKMIPDEVVEAALHAYDMSFKNDYTTGEQDIAAAIAAALNAWPGVCKSESVCGWSKWIELPIEEEQ